MFKLSDPLWNSKVYVRGESVLPNNFVTMLVLASFIYEIRTKVEQKMTCRLTSRPQLHKGLSEC